MLGVDPLIRQATYGRVPVTRPFVLSSNVPDLIG